jgi:hypothetical protein
MTDPLSLGCKNESATPQTFSNNKQDCETN